MGALGQSPYESLLGDSIHRTATIMWIGRVLGSLPTKKKNTAVALMTSEKFQLWVAEKNNFNFPAEVKSNRLKGQYYEAHIGRLSKISHKKAISFVQTQLENAFNQRVVPLLTYLENPQLQNIRGNWHYTQVKNPGRRSKWKASKGTVTEGFGSSQSVAQQDAIFQHFFK